MAPLPDRQAGRAASTTPLWTALRRIGSGSLCMPSPALQRLGRRPGGVGKTWMRCGAAWEERVGQRARPCPADLGDASQSPGSARSRRQRRGGGDPRRERGRDRCVADWPLRGAGTTESSPVGAISTRALPRPGRRATGSTAVCAARGIVGRSTRRCGIRAGGASPLAIRGSCRMCVPARVGRRSGRAAFALRGV